MFRLISGLHRLIIHLGSEMNIIPVVVENNKTGVILLI